MAKTLVGGMRQVSIGPNIMNTAAHAGVLVDRRREIGAGSKYMKGLGEWVLQREVYSSPQQEPAAEQGPIEESEEVLHGVDAVVGKVMTELVELDLDAEMAEESVPV